MSDIINKLETKFGKMTIIRGKLHTFVGMDIELTEDKKVIFFMKEYIRECIEAFEQTGDKIKGKGNTPATNTLFEVNKNVNELDSEKSEVFHHIVSKLLYVSKRARIDIDLAISFLCTRVSKSTEDDWNKLRRVLVYLKHTKNMPRVIAASNLDDVGRCIVCDTRGHEGSYWRCNIFGNWMYPS